jgi:hypothetical protein
LLGTIVSLVLTVAVSRVAGWVFLAFLIAWLASSVARRVLLHRWERRARGDSSLLRIGTPLRILRLAAFALGGIAGAVIGAHIAKPSFAVYPGFVVGGTIASFLATWPAALRLRSAHAPERGVTRPEARFDRELGLVAETLRQTAPDRGWANLVARAQTSAYDAGHAAALVADPRRATRITLKRQRLAGVTAEVEEAWTQVIDAARRGIADAETDREERR